MSYGKHSESSASRRSMDDDTTEDGGDERDESKRRSRNLSEKKRRDQFNVLINELCTMVSTAPRKMDKSTVLKATITFLKAHNELSVQSQVQETQEDWKPSFLSNEEFTHLMMEALDGFIIVVSSVGRILYLSESITSLLGYLSTDLVNGQGTIYDYVLPEERNDLYGILSNADDKCKGPVSIVINFRIGLEMNDDGQKYQLVKLVGYFKRWMAPTDCGSKSSSSDKNSGGITQSLSNSGNGYALIATGRLVVCDLLREMSVVVDSEKNEFASRHSLEWKFLFLDHRAPPIIGYMPFEMLGTSGYDYYHVEDLEKVATCHEALMQRGEGTSCYYRFLTKGQQWIWLQTRFYITYHQWNSKPEFIVCTHRVVSYADVMKELRGETTTSAFEDSPSIPRLGPSGPKHPKLTLMKGSSLKGSRHKNGGLSYGSVGAKSNSCLRKLELPPKFASSFNASTQSSQIPTQNQPLSSSQLSQVVSTSDTLTSSCNNVNLMYDKPLDVTAPLSFHTEVAKLSTTSHQSTNPSTTSVQPNLNFSVAPSTSVQNQDPTFAIATEPTQSAVPSQILPMDQDFLIGQPVLSSPPCDLQEQLLKKHAELQRQITQQQEELRRVSELISMTQCGWIQGDSLLMHPSQGDPIQPQQQEEIASAQLQPIQCPPQQLMPYSPHVAPVPPTPMDTAAVQPSTNDDTGCFGLSFRSEVT